MSESDHEDAAPLGEDPARVQDPRALASKPFHPRVMAGEDPTLETLPISRRSEGGDAREVKARLEGDLESSLGGVHGFRGTVREPRDLTTSKGWS